MNLYKLKQKIEKTLKKIPFIYRIGHSYRLRKEKRKDELLNRAFKEYGYVALKDVQSTMEKTDIDFFAFSGTLLGIIRDKALIAHDNDLDFAVIENEKFDWDIVVKAMERINFQPSRSFLIGEEVYEMTFVRDGLGVDFFIGKKDQGERKTPYFYRTTLEEYSERWEHSVAFLYFPEVESISKAEVHGISVNIPSNYKDIFYGNYGPNWKEPDENWNVWDAPKLIKDKDLKAIRINH